ncbi:MAG: hypothetical protein ACREM8_04405 [Vulcanimicrobiaceae bacterium]
MPSAAVPAMVTGLFVQSIDADRAIRQLVERGYQRDEIGVLARGERSAEKPLDNSATGPAQGVQEKNALKTGALVGGIFAVGAFATIVLTGGLAVLAAGPIAAIVAAVAGGGGIAGVLAGAGIPEDKVEQYTSELEGGGILVAVQPHPGDDDGVRAILGLGTGPEKP